MDGGYSKMCLSLPDWAIGVPHDWKNLLGVINADTDRPPEATTSHLLTGSYVDRT